MPELPEVETIRRHLAPHVEGRTLGADGLDERWCRPLAPDELAAATDGRVVERLSRRGKYLVFELDGRGLPAAAPADDRDAAAGPGRARRPTRACASTSATTSCVFVDPRRFGTGELALGAGRAATRSSPPGSGVEPFDEAFTTAHLRALARALPRADQGVPARPEADRRRRQHLRRRGAASARASTRCGRPASSRGPSWTRCARRSIASLEAGIAAKGATIDDFRDPYGVQRHVPGPVPRPPARGRAVRRTAARGS